MLNYQRVTRNIMSQHWSTRKPKKKHEETKKLSWSTQLTTFCAMVKGKAQVGSGLLFGWRELTNLCTNMYIVYIHIYIGMILDTNVLIVPLKMRFLPDSQRWPWRQIFFTASESAWSLMDCNHGSADLRFQSVLSFRHSGNSGRLPKNTGEVMVRFGNSSASFFGVAAIEIPNSRVFSSFHRYTWRF